MKRRNRQGAAALTSNVTQLGGSVAHWLHTPERSRNHPLVQNAKRPFSKEGPFQWQLRAADYPPALAASAGVLLLAAAAGALLAAAGASLFVSSSDGG